MNLTEVIELAAGKIQGLQQQTSLGGDYYAFFGIPYAEPPIEKLRFCRPKRLNPWSGILKAKNKNIRALQNMNKIMGQEDCLYLNVYRPSYNENINLLPVMVFIHGGGFQAGDGSPDLYGPDYFMNEGIVLVTINYRLGAFGFLTLRSDVAPGNLGLWDQKMALEWVKDNIEKFGGDSSNVTIFGESAGAMSVMMHVVSPQSKGLFHKVIAQSGTFLCAYEPNYYKRNSGKILATKLGMDVHSKSDTEILEFLQNASLSKIKKWALSEREDITKSTLPLLYEPCIDDYSSDPFLPDDGLTLLEKGLFNKIPIMQGVNRDEGLFALLSYTRDKVNMQQINKNWQKEALKLLCDYDEELDNPTLNEMMMEVKKFYFNNQDVTETNFQSFANLYADKWFNAQFHLSSQLINKNSEKPLYRYVFDYEGKFSMIGTLFQSMTKLFCKIILKKILNKDVFNDRKSGVNHTDELPYLFKNKYGLNSTDCSADNSVRENMVKLWASFSISGQPSCPGSDEWTPYDRQNQYEYYQIKEKCSMETFDENWIKRLDFWINNMMKKNNWKSL